MSIMYIVEREEKSYAGNKHCIYDKLWANVCKGGRSMRISMEREMMMMMMMRERWMKPTIYRRGFSTWLTKYIIAACAPIKLSSYMWFKLGCTRSILTLYTTLITIVLSVSDVTFACYYNWCYALTHTCCSSFFFFVDKCLKFVDSTLY